MTKPPSQHHRYQTDPATRTVVLGGIHITEDPLVVDYSSTYPNNQESAVVVEGRTITDGTADVSGIVGNIVITDKTAADGTFLFYQYQPKYDSATSGQFRVVDADGDPVPYVTQYGYVQPSGGLDPILFRLGDHQELEHDSLGGHSEIGLPTGATVFAPYTTPSGGLGYQTHADALAAGAFQFLEFNGAPLPEEATIDFTFILGAESVYRDTIYADDWAIAMGSGQIGLKTNGDEDVINLTNEYWYRGRVTYDATSIELRVYRETQLGSVDQTFSIVPSGFTVDVEDTSINHLAVFEPPVPDVNWHLPAFLPRYDQALRWADGPLAEDDRYRIRILTESNDPAFITYDAAISGSVIQQNRVEPMNFVPIYQESVTEQREWTRSGDDILLAGDAPQTGTIYVKPLFEGLISVDVIQNQVVVTNGSFRSDPFDETSGKYTYELLEYENLMPFATDNQNFVYPKSIKEVRAPATILTAHTVQVLPMVVYEGHWKDYVIPGTEDIRKVVQNDTVVETTGDIDVVTWRKTRGVNVYVNGRQLANEDITAVDSNQGIIYLKNAIKVSDHVEVTYLRRSSYFICNFPRLRPEIRSGRSWRIYLRSNWPNYFLEDPSDTLERLAYREIVNGEPTGDMKSCVSDEVVMEPAGTIKLADVSAYPVITFSDERSFGGGLVADTEFGSETERLTQFPHSLYFADISNWRSPVAPGSTNLIPAPSVFIRIPTAVRSKVEARFSTSAAALAYIKGVIEKHLALGVFYIIIDENNQPWENAFPEPQQPAAPEMEL